MSKNLDFEYLFEPELDFFDPNTNAQQAANEAAENSVSTSSDDAAASVSLAHAEAPKKDERPASERIASLLESMKSQRKVFLQTLAFCNEPKAIDEVNAHVAQLQKAAPSVYSPANICAFLEQAGALQRQTEEGTPVSELDLEPKATVIDGVEYLEPTQAPQTFWLRTQAGSDALAADDPAQRLADVIAQEERYTPIYQKIIELCSGADGASITQLGNALDNDPLLQEPRYYVQRFVNKLEECDAIAWNDAWFATKTGTEFLARKAS